MSKKTRIRTLTVVVSSFDHKTLDVSVAKLVEALEKVIDQVEISIVPGVKDEVSGQRIHIRKFLVPQVDDKTLVKLSQLSFPKTVLVKLFET